MTLMKSKKYLIGRVYQSQLLKPPKHIFPLKSIKKHFQNLINIHKKYSDLVFNFEINLITFFIKYVFQWDIT